MANQLFTSRSTSRPAGRARAVLAMTALTLAACGGNRDAQSDTALKNDLSMTNRPAGQQTVSPQELTPNQTAPVAAAPGTAGPNGAPVTALAPVAPAPAPRTDTVVRTVYRDRPAQHHHHASSSAGSSSGTYSSGSASGGTVAEQPTVRHSNTKQGAIIGGAAGAVLGAVTSRDKIKGGLVGGILGGAAGAVIGNNTGVKHEPQ